MKSVIGSLLLLSVSMLSAGAGIPADTPLPEIDGKPVVSTVNGVPITLDAFAAALAQAHEGAMEAEQQIARRDPAELLDRLIGIELVVQEAENIGLDELPEVRDAIASHAKMSRRNLVLGRQARQITPDAEQVEALYRERIREVRIDSILLDSEQDALALKSRIEAGESFSALAQEAAAAGTANPNDSQAYLKPDALLPIVRDAISELEVGQVSSVIPIGEQFSVLRLVDIRHVDDPAVRKQTEEFVLKGQRLAALRRYTETLRDQYTTFDEVLFKSLDYSAEGPGLEAMLADQRVIVKVDGGQPITVAELTGKLAEKAFHGAEAAIRQGKFDRRAHSVLDDLRKKRALDLEAGRLKVEETQQFRTGVDEFRKGVLFDKFLERAIDPSINLERVELERYLEQHIEEYSTPEMIRLDALAFLKRSDAEAALDKLRQGADFQWMRANATGQVTPGPDTELLQFNGRMPIVSEALPDGVRKAVAGARAGDFRFFAASEGPAYVLVVRDKIPAEPREFDAVRDSLARRVHGAKRQAAFDEWVGQLRAASEIEIFATGEALLGAMGVGPANSD